MLGECRRVEDYEVVFVADVFEVLDGIARDCRMVRSVAEIQTDILLSEFDGAFRCVD